MLGRGLERRIRLFHVAKGEMMRDQLAGLDATGGEQLQQHGRGDGVDQAGGQRDIVHPQLLDLQGAGLAVHADVGDGAAGSDQVLGHLQRLGHADGLHDGVAADVVGEGHDALERRRLGAVDGVVGAQLFGHLQPAGVAVDHDDQAGRVEFRGHQRGEPDGAGAHDGNR